MSKRVIFDASSRDYNMRNNGFGCGFNMPNALKGDIRHGLPPYVKRMPYLVDEFPACPERWMRSEGKLKSFFVPVKEDKGMWLDFNECENNTHEVAIVISVQGVNPITGLPCNDPQMEQYIETCPKHKTKFGPDRFCEKCGYRWPKQNYICTTGTPSGQLWIDGFKAADGVVRQYILTEEKMRGVASNIIGKDRVYAIGLSFFLSKDKKVVQSFNTTRGLTYGQHQVYGQPQMFSPVHTPINWQYTPSVTCDSLDIDQIVTASLGETYDSDSLGLEANDASAESLGSTKSSKAIRKMAKGMVEPVRRKGNYKADKEIKSIQTKKLEVGAGAKINQNIYDDPKDLDFWHDNPEAIICINYCTEKETRRIIEAGTVDVKGSEEGFLKDVPVGN